MNYNNDKKSLQIEYRQLILLQIKIHGMIS